MYDIVADIDRLINAVKAAPSVLNTQPWLFQVVADDRINLRAERDRRLRYVDPEERELVISCGAALLNLRLALQVAGHDSVVWLMPDEKNDRDLLASVEIVSTRAHRPTLVEQRLYESIPRRHTNRQPFERKLLHLNIVAELESAAWQERAYLWLLHQHETHVLLSDIRKANRKINEDPRWEDYRNELGQYTNEPMLKRGLGIPPEAFGPLPANGHIPYRDLGLEWQGPGERERKSFEKHTRLLAISTDTNTRTDWLRAGQGLQRVLLTAASRNAAASFYTQPLEPVNEEDRPQNPWWPWRRFPQMVMRVGHCSSPAAETPRLHNEELWEDLRSR
jgi:hypothetical protein